MLVCLFWCYRFCAVMLCAMSFLVGFYIGCFVVGGFAGVSMLSDLTCVGVVAGDAVCLIVLLLLGYLYVDVFIYFDLLVWYG